MRRIGILGGMMDPVHRGHLAAAKAALAAGMDTVLLAPCLAPPHRPAPLAAAEHRLEMCRLAAQEDGRLEASDIDLRHETCYAADTARLLAKRYPGAELYWIIGADKLPGLSRWHEAEALFSLCQFLVCPRPGASDDIAVPGARVTRLDMQPIAASSGDAIQRLRALEDAPELLPKALARYIAQNGLYQPDYVPALRCYGMQDKRLQHTLGVRDTAVELASLHGASMQAAAVAAMLHDIAKPLPLAEMQRVVRGYGLALPEEVTRDANLLHGPAAAAIAENELGVTHPGVLSAIGCHTTGKPGMSILDKVIFIADAIEPNRRPYPGLEDMRRLARTDLDAAVLLSMRRTNEYVLSRGYHFCHQTELAMEYLQQKEEKS